LSAWSTWSIWRVKRRVVPHLGALPTRFLADNLSYIVEEHLWIFVAVDNRSVDGNYLAFATHNVQLVVYDFPCALLFYKVGLMMNINDRLALKSEEVLFS